MTLKVRVHRGRLGTEQYRVIRPANPVTAAALGLQPMVRPGNSTPTPR